MMDLGKYAGDILVAYGITGVLVLGLVAQSIWAARAARRDLDDEE